MYKNILLAMDGSDDAQRAAKKVIEFYEPGNSRILAFHSYKHHLIPISIPFTSIGTNPIIYSPSIEEYQNIVEQSIKNGKQILENTKKLFLDANIEIETRLISDKDPEEYINQITKEENFDLVVMGCKGDHSKLEQIFVGSVAQKVLNSKNPADLLVVR